LAKAREFSNTMYCKIGPQFKGRAGLLKDEMNQFLKIKGH
jgi:hypothetical protein